MQSYSELQKLYKYFKKAINTKLSPELLRNKEKLNNALKSDIESYVRAEYSAIPELELHTIVKNTRYWNFEIQRLIKHKLEITSLHTSVNKTTKSLGGIAKTTVTCERKSKLKPQTSLNRTMANPDPVFDIRQATALVQPYDGAPAGLDTFVDSVNLLKDLTPAAQLPMAMKFIKTRLSGKARIGLPENLQSIDELIEIITTKCEDNTTPENILSKMNAIKQRGSMNGFCEEIESLCSKLENTYIKQRVPATVAKSMSTKAGLNALINGINTPETKLILKAGNFTSIKEAIQKAQENSTENTNSAQVLNTRFKTNAYQNNNSREHDRPPFQNRFRRGVGSHYNHNRNTPNRQNYGSRNFSQNNYNGGRPQHNPGNFAHRGRGRANNWQMQHTNPPAQWRGNQRNMYIAASEAAQNASQQGQIQTYSTGVTVPADCLPTNQATIPYQMTPQQGQLPINCNFLAPRY